MKSSNDPQAIAETLIDAALRGGSRDNITCIVIIVD
jgi:serine/threonine protein phosphatase PrpC